MLLFDILIKDFEVSDSHLEMEILQDMIKNINNTKYVKKRVGINKRNNEHPNAQLFNFINIFHLKIIIFSYFFS